MPPRCLPPSQLGQIYKHHGGFRVQLSASMAGFRGVATRIVRGPQRPKYLRARQDLARARKCPSREAMVAFVSGGCRHENLPSDPETLRAEQTANLSQRRICGKQPLSVVRQRVSVALLQPRAEAKAAAALRGDNPQEPPRRTMTGNAGAAPMVARGVAAARAETPRAEAARAEAAGAEARWEAAKTRGWSALNCHQHPIMKEVEEMQEVDARSRQRAADMLVEARQAASAQSDARAEAARAEESPVGLRRRKPPLIGSRNLMAALLSLPVRSRKSCSPPVTSRKSQKKAAADRPKKPHGGASQPAANAGK